MKGNFTVIDPQLTGDAFITSKPSVYIYPITPYMYANGSNDYILRVKELMQEDFEVVNKVTTLGIFDILLKLHKCDLLYFNWIADIADRRFGYLQIIVLFFILVVCKITGIRVAWFIHNDLSHSKKNRFAKKLVERMMMVFADISFSHSHEISIAPKLKRLDVFEHPVDHMKHLDEKDQEIDLLVWGSVSPYKGVHEFAEFNYGSSKLDHQNIMVAGKFTSDAFFEETSRYSKENIRFINDVQSEEALEELFRKSRYVLFCYRSRSVMSSAALCKSLSYGKTVIGPNIGSFKELGRKGLIYTYESFEEMADIVLRLKQTNKQVDKGSISAYIQSTSWQEFGNFLCSRLHETLADSNTPVIAT